MEGLPPSCVNRLRALETTHVPLARALATRLHANREKPAVIVDYLLTQPLTDAGALTKKPTKPRKKAVSPGTSWPAAAWLAVGEFANEYSLGTRAAECFLRADAAGAKPAGRCTAFAGLMLADTDPDRARSLFEAVQEIPAARMPASIGLASLNHAGSTAVLPVPEEITSDPEGADQDPNVQHFLGAVCLRAGDLTGAIDHHRRALELAPESVEQQLELADMLLRRHSSAPGPQRFGDIRRAAHLADAARTARRRWLGDSIRAAELLMRARLLSDEYGSALRVATLGPAGEATELEASAPELAGQAAHAAYEHGQLERADGFAAVVTASASTSWMARLAAVRASVLDAPPEERQRLWQEALVQADRDELRMIVVHHLAGLGVWPIPELDELYEARLLSAAVYHAIKANALDALGQHDDALALLRQYRNDSVLAAEFYVQFVAKTNNVEACVRACDQASARFAEPRLDLFALDVLQKAKRVNEVLSRAAALLARPSLGFQLRQRVRQLLIELESELKEWATCERLATDGLHDITALGEDLRSGRTDPLTLPATVEDELGRLRNDYSWLIIVNQFNQGQIAMAMSSLDNLAPEIISAQQVRAWLSLYQVSGWTTAAVDTALDLAERPSMPLDLVGRILFTLVQILPPAPDTADGPAGTVPGQDGLVVSAQMHERLQTALRTYQDTNAKAVALSPADADDPSNVGPSSSAAAASLMRRAQVIQDAIWSLRLPVGVATLSGGKPLLLVLLQRLTGVLPAVPIDKQVYAAEVAAALDSLGETVCVDTTALYVAAAVLDRWPALSSRFAEILLPDPVASDILTTQAAVHALTNVVGFASVDPSSGQLSISPLDDQERVRIQQQSHAVRDSAQQCRNVPVLDLSNLDTEATLEDTGVWKGPLSVALAQQVALYSDDVVLRAAARTHGVTAFGTMALLEALGQGLTPESETAAATVMSLFENYVVDLPITQGFLLAYAAAHGPVSRPILVALSRRATWAVDHLGLVEVVIRLVRAVGREARQDLAELIAAAAAGLAGCYSPQEKVLALLGMSVLLDGTGLDPDAVSIVVPALGGVAARYGIDLLPVLRAYLMGSLTAPDGGFALTVEAAQQQVAEAFRDLPGP